MILEKLKIVVFFFLIALISLGCKKDECPDCVLRIHSFVLNEISFRGELLEEGAYGSDSVSNEINVIVDGVVHGRRRDAPGSIWTSPILGWIPPNTYGEDTLCYAYRQGTGLSYEWCPCSDNPQIIIEYFLPRDGLPAIDLVFHSTTLILPRLAKEYKDVVFVSGDYRLKVDITFTDSEYPR